MNKQINIVTKDDQNEWGDQCNISSPTFIKKVNDYEEQLQSLPQQQLNQELKKSIHYSESLQNLIQSSALTNTVEMCEAFVIIGPHETALQKALRDKAHGTTPDDGMHNYNRDSFLERQSQLNLPESLQQCNAVILDTYPSIFKNEETNFETLHTQSTEHQIQLMSLIKEQYLYLSNIQLICFPDGYYFDTEFRKHKLQDFNVNTSQNRPSLLLNQTKLLQSKYKVMHFTITQSSGEKKYLTSLEYKVTLIIIISDRKLLQQNTKMAQKKKECFALCRNVYYWSLDYLSSQFKKEYQDSDNFLQIEQNLNKAKSLIKIERLEFYLSAFFHHLQIDGSNLEIEIYKKATLPTREDDSNQIKKTLVKYVNTFNKECLRLENYDFRLLFQKVRPKMLMQMFVSLLHERKIILIHNESGKNAILIEALISLLYPLQWNFTNISYLIPSMVEYLEAPFPYIVGVPRDLWKYIYEQKWDILGEEVVAFDIDNNRYYTKEDLPEFPQPYTQLLIKQLEIQLEKSKNIGSNSARGDYRSNEIDNHNREEEKFWNNFTLKVKQQFLNFLIFLINTFENFYIKNQKESPLKNVQASISGQGTAPSTIDSTIDQKQAFSNGGSANDIFNFDEYVQNVRENQSFFEKFVRTQAFINFIEQAYFEEQGNLSDASIRFFKECTRKLSNENIQAVRAMQDSIISALMHKFNNRGISYSIDKCHLMYEKQLQMINSQVSQTQFPLTKDKGTFLISRLDQNRIIKMKVFDPKPFIEKKYSRAIESTLEYNNIKEKSLKKPQAFYHEILKDLSIDEPPRYEEGLSNIYGQGVNFGEYFTVQVTPNGHEPIIIEQDSVNKTTQLIKIEDNLDSECSNVSPDKNGDKVMIGEERLIKNLILPDEDDEAIEEKGLFGFFKKTFSSVKKTFENTFNNQNKQASISQSRGEKQSSGKRTPLFENELEESPSQQRVNRQSNGINRTARSQTFHVETRDRKNNESFFANLFNIGSNSKKDNAILQQSSSLSPRFFVFNEEDMKKMTEMSPQDTKKNANLRSSSLNFDFRAIENQLSQRQKPQIKSNSIFNNHNQATYISNRLRSISYQQYQTMFGSEVKDTLQRQPGLMDLNNDSVDKSSNADDSVIIGHYNINLQSMPNSGKKTIPYTSKLLQSDSRNQNASESLGDPQQYFNKDMGQKLVQSFRQTPLLSNQSSAMKGQIEKSLPPKQKKEFEEIYKKSTENLYFAPTVRSIEGTHRQQQKYNIWKSQTGKLGDLKTSQKPPKHQNLQRKSRQVVEQISQQSQQQIKIVVKKEEKKQLQKSHEGIYSDKNSTDEDQKAPILGKNLSSFNKIMFSRPFDKGKKQQPVIQSQPQVQMKHKRQLSGGMGNIQIKGDNNQQSVLNLNNSLMENIDPEDDNKLYQSNNKQIEVMQIGRSRKKSSNKKLNQVTSKPQSRRSSNNPNTYNLKPPSVNKITSNKIQSSSVSNYATSNPAHLKQLTKAPPKNQQLKDLPNVREEPDREIGINTKINYKSMQAKTVQSSSYSSIQSFGSSHNSHKHAQVDQMLQENETKRKLLEKEYQEKEEIKIDPLEESNFSSHSQSEVTIKPSKINIINQSIDLRDSKKGEFLRLRSQAGVVSPSNENKNNYNLLSVSKYSASLVQGRIHSFSQYADLESKQKIIEMMNMKSLNDRGIDDLKQNDPHSLSKYGGFRNQLKPISKITFEASNQIAKLSGDVDHEPSTPKSGTNISNSDDE